MLRPFMRRAASYLGVAVLAGFAASALADEPTPASLGRKIFFDASLSASGQMSCASCHDPAHAHAQSNASAVQFGGPESRCARHAQRAVAALSQRFRVFIRWRRHADRRIQSRRPRTESARAGRAAAAVGKRDGERRCGNVRRQARARRVCRRIQKRLRRRRVRRHRWRVLSRAVRDRSVRAKRDLRCIRSIRNTTVSSPARSCFRRPNCAVSRCSTVRTKAIARPAIRARAARTDRRPFSPITRTTISAFRATRRFRRTPIRLTSISACAGRSARISNRRRDLCGAFKVPTLRNVATRQVFFHNGNVQDAARRAAFLRAARHESGGVLSARRERRRREVRRSAVPNCIATSTHEEVPYERHPGQAPRLDDAEIDDVIAFLGTLTDGYDAATDTADPARSIAPTN